MSSTKSQKKTVLSEPSKSALARVSDTLRTENAGAILLALGTVIALLWANSPFAGSYEALSSFQIGPSALHLRLTVGQWATDGLLAIFFFVVGLELKQEIVSGQLRRPSTAIVPILAAVGGMIGPALIYLSLNLGRGEPQGWAVPVATDIAFAVAIVTIFGKRLPPALRAFLLTLAVVDDLLGIIVIAVFYTATINLLSLLGAALAIAAFALLVRKVGGASPLILIPLAVTAWGLMHGSGVHATIAGCILGFTVPALARDGESQSLAERYGHWWSPISAGVAVPLFALFAVGVRLDPASLAQVATEPVAQGVICGLVLGKPIGIALSTFLLVKLSRATLDPSLRWRDICAVGSVAGIGFTVALLIAELSFPSGDPLSETTKAAVLVASLLSAMIGAIALTICGRTSPHGKVASA